MPFTISDNDESTYLEQSMWMQSDIDAMIYGVGGDGVISGCAVAAQGSPNMTLAVASGLVQIDGVSVLVDAGNVTITTADGSNPRIDLVVVSSTGAKSVTAGTAAANPKAPALSASTVLLAMVYVPASDTAIGSTQITDKRVFIPRDPNGINVQDYGAVPDKHFEDGVMTSGSAVLNSATAGFTSADVGKYIVVLKAGPSTHQALHSTIASVGSATQCTLSHNAGRNAGPARFFYGTDQTTAFQTALNAAGDRGGGAVFIPPGSYPVSTLVIPHRVRLQGAGKRNTTLHLLPSIDGPVLRNCPGAATTLTGSHSTAATTLTVGATTDFISGQRVSVLLTSGLYHDTKISSITDSTHLVIAVGLPSGASGSAAVAQPQGQMIVIRDMAIDGNRARQAGSTGLAHAIYLSSREGASPEPEIDEDFDSHYIIDNLFLYNTKNNGVRYSGRGEARMRDVQTYYNDGNGIQSSFDCVMVGCSTGVTGLEGFKIANSSVRLVGCKAWYAGSIVDATRGHGYWIDGVGFGTISLTACEGQDNRANGVYINNASRVTMAGCTFDTNNNLAGQGDQTGEYVAIHLNDATNCIIEASLSTDRGSGLTTGLPSQVSAVKLTGTSTGNRVSVTHSLGAAPSAVTISTASNATPIVVTTSGNHNYQTNNVVLIAGVSGSTTANGLWVITRTGATTFTLNSSTAGGAGTGGTSTLQPVPIHPASTSVGGNDIRINNQEGHQLIAYAATVTPNPYAGSKIEMGTLTGNITVNEPVIGTKHEGLQMVMSFLQDGTGGRGITFGSGYRVLNFSPNLSPAAYNTIQFFYDGTNWVQMPTYDTLVYSTLAASTAIASTTSETNFSTAHTIYGNTLKVGDLIQVRAYGTFGTTSTPTLTIKVKWGTVVLATTGAQTMPTAASPRGWWLDFYATVISIGAAGTMECQGVAQFASTALAAPTVMDMENTAVVTGLSTTANTTLQISAQWGTSNASNTITLRVFAVQLLR